MKNELNETIEDLGHEVLGLQGSLADIINFIGESARLTRVEELIKLCEGTIKKITNLDEVEVVFKGGEPSIQDEVIDIPVQDCDRVEKIRFKRSKNDAIGRSLHGKAEIVELCAVFLDAELGKRMERSERAKKEEAIKYRKIISIIASLIAITAFFYYLSIGTLHPDVMLFALLAIIVLAASFFLRIIH